jgi:hypothetical protein
MSRTRTGTKTFSVDLPPAAIDAAKRQAAACGETLGSFVEALITKRELAAPVATAAGTDARLLSALATAKAALDRGDLAKTRAQLAFASDLLFEHFNALRPELRRWSDARAVREDVGDEWGGRGM